MAKQKKKMQCVVCKKEEAFPVVIKGFNPFDKCLDCAIEYMNKLRHELISILSTEQFAALQKYERAVDERVAMQILIDKGFLR